MDPDALYSDVVGKYGRHINPYLARLMSFAGFGVEMRAEGCYIWDQEGNRFLDCLGGYGTFSLGHRHPKVVEAVKRQLDEMALSGKAFFSKQAADLAEKLAEIAPPGVEFVFFSNSGTEAVEAALKFAKGMTGRVKIVSTEGSYHGKTLGALATTGREKYRKRFEPLMPGVVFVPFGDAEAATAAVDGDTAAMIVEPIQGEGGIIVPPDGYLRVLRDACDRHGALLIADEVQSGLGRAGDMFGCNHDGISPDLMPLAKSLGGGVMPIGATMGTKAVFESIYSPNPLAHTSTFGGNPLACAAGLAGILVLQEEGLVERSRIQGAKLKGGLQDVADRQNELVKEVRGRGLMIGVEFQMDEVGELVVAQLLKRGVCVAYALNNPKVLRFEPPLIISDSQIEDAVTAFDEAVAETAELLAAIA
ncbi:aspartate aminotransferase family protein [Fimbriimonas ginsengisoli]|uniref:Acetylornithine and succinylornithine aminotransferase n=1 Tax=Fimbriimonas ginsengisoli Gsoil 348 TaxID=661478 RepID=A0A068NWL6_FIMGI|nr:aspartate aminotransferase family protein [Fimbriimonas ginsengisoli]AIE87841.1 acetylornithine and succinylornithine aminotransferase [Fimbriimonas ginsengisoli Gsoil 348]